MSQLYFEPQVCKQPSKSANEPESEVTQRLKYASQSYFYGFAQDVVHSVRLVYKPVESSEHFPDEASHE